MTDSMENDVVLASLDMQVPAQKWLAQLSQLFSDARFLMLSMIPIQNTIANCFLQIKGSRLNEILALFSKLHTSDSESVYYQVLHEPKELHQGGFLLINVHMQDPWILNTILRHQLLIRFPVRIQNGQIHMNLLAARHKIDAVLTHFENQSLQFRLNQIGKYRPQLILTEQQQILLSLALKHGYYDIPRRTTLSEIAQRQNRSPPAVSEMFRRLHKKLAQFYFRK